MEPRSGQGRAGAMAFALFAGAFRLLAWINGGAALVLVFFMLGVIGSDVAAPDLRAAGAVPGGFPGACGGLLFGWLAQASLLRQGDTLRPGRRHWPAQALAVLSMWRARCASAPPAGWPPVPPPRPMPR